MTTTIKTAVEGGASADLLDDCGAALYGVDWKAPLARALGVTDRTVRRWSVGDNPVPDKVWSEIAGLVARHIGTLNRLHGRIVATSCG